MYKRTTHKGDGEGKKKPDEFSEVNANIRCDTCTHVNRMTQPQKLGLLVHEKIGRLTSFMLNIYIMGMVSCGFVQVSVGE